MSDASSRECPKCRLPEYACQCDSDPEPLRRMVEEAIRRRLLCVALIDQDRYIGGDPVGHACGSLATSTFWRGGLGWPVCERCKAMLREEPERVTLLDHMGMPGGDVP